MHESTAHSEQIPTRVHPQAEPANAAVAAEIAALIRHRGRREEALRAWDWPPARRRSACMPSWSACIARRGCRLRASSRSISTNTYPMQPVELQSYRRFMREHLFDHVDIRPEERPYARRHDPGSSKSPITAANTSGRSADVGRARSAASGHRPDGAYRLQRAGLAHRQPHAADRARPRHAPRRRQRFLRRGACAAAGDHDGRRHDPRGPADHHDGLRRGEGAGRRAGRRRADHADGGRQLSAKSSQCAGRARRGGGGPARAIQDARG